MTVGTETLVMKMSGTIWIADKGPGVEEYKALTKAASESGFSTAFMAQGPTAKGMVEMQKAMAEAGIPLSQEFQMTMEGTGQAAAALAQMGNMTMVTTVTALTTDPIADEVFALPAVHQEVAVRPRSGGRARSTWTARASGLPGWPA